MQYSRLTMSQITAQDYLELECSLCLFFSLSLTPGPLACSRHQNKLVSDAQDQLISFGYAV